MLLLPKNSLKKKNVYLVKKQKTVNWKHSFNYPLQKNKINKLCFALSVWKKKKKFSRFKLILQSLIPKDKNRKLYSILKILVLIFLKLNKNIFTHKTKINNKNSQWLLKIKGKNLLFLMYGSLILHDLFYIKWSWFDVWLMYIHSYIAIYISNKIWNKSSNIK
jgi:hypothetical protein